MRQGSRLLGCGQSVRAVHPSSWVRMSVWRAAFFRIPQQRGLASAHFSLAYESVASSEPLLPT